MARSASDEVGCQQKHGLLIRIKWRSKPCPFVPHRGFKDTACFDLWLATFHILEMLYDSPYPTEPQNDLPTKAERNAELRIRYQQGEPISQLATTFGISEQRVWQIIRGQRN